MKRVKLAQQPSKVITQYQGKRRLQISTLKLRMNHSIAKVVSRWGAMTTSSPPAIVRCGSTLKVLLLDKLENYGAKGDVVDVKRGYARNFLIPRKKAGKFYLLIAY